MYITCTKLESSSFFPSPRQLVKIRSWLSWLSFVEWLPTNLKPRFCFLRIKYCTSPITVHLLTFDFVFSLRFSSCFITNHTRHFWEGGAWSERERERSVVRFFGFFFCFRDASQMHRKVSSTFCDAVSIHFISRFDNSKFSPWLLTYFFCSQGSRSVLGLLVPSGWFYFFSLGTTLYCFYTFSSNTRWIPFASSKLPRVWWIFSTQK